MDEVTPVPLQPARLRTDVFLTFGGKLGTLLLALGISSLIPRELRFYELFKQQGAQIEAPRI